MSCDNNDLDGLNCVPNKFHFDPEKSAIENLFALIYRANKVRLDPCMFDISDPESISEDVHGDNTKITLKGRKGSPIAGELDLYYARADLDTHYPTFWLDANDFHEWILGTDYLYPGKEALKEYVDGKFNLIDSDFEVDIDDPFDSLFKYFSFDIVSKEGSYVYIGKKTIHIFMAMGIRRITDDGELRVTDEGLVRIVDVDPDYVYAQQNP